MRERMLYSRLRGICEIFDDEIDWSMDDSPKELVRKIRMFSEKVWKEESERLKIELDADGTPKVNYGKLIAEKLRKEGLKPVGGDGSRLEGFRRNDRVRVEFAYDGSALVHRWRKRSRPSIFPRRGENSVIRLRKVYSPEELERTLRENGIEWLGFDEKDIPRPIHSNAYPGRENSPADVVVYLRRENAFVRVQSEAAERWCAESDLFFRRHLHRGWREGERDSTDIKKLVDVMRKANLKVLVRSVSFSYVRGSYYLGAPFYGGRGAGG